MNTHSPRPGNCGGCQPSNNGQSFSVAVGLARQGHLSADKDDKLTNQVPLDRPRLARRLIGVTSPRNPSPVDARLDETTPISRRMAAQPSADNVGPMDPKTAEMAANPQRRISI